MNWIKGLVSKINEMGRLVILLVLTAYVIYLNVKGIGGDVWLVLRSLVPFLVIIAGITYLQFNKKEFAAHLALLLFAFLPAGSRFINSLFSITLKPFEFAITPTLEVFLGFIAFLYLVVMSIGLFITQKPEAKVTRKDILVTTIIAGIFFYLRGGIYLTIAKLMLPVVSLIFGLPLATIFFLVAGVLDVPFDFMYKMFNQDILTIPISYYLFSLFAFYLIYGAIKGIIGELKK